LIFSGSATDEPPNFMTRVSGAGWGTAVTPGIVAVHPTVRLETRWSADRIRELGANRRGGREMGGKRFRIVFVVLAAAGAILVPTAAQADSSFYAGPVFGIDTGPGGTLLVANVGKGVVDGDSGAVLALASEFSATGLNDVAPIAGSDDLWAVTGGNIGIEDQQFLYRVDGDGDATEIADLWAFEEKFNPSTDLNSNPFDVENLGGGEALVVDAGGNTLLKVDKHGKVKLVAVFPEELVSTANVKDIVGCSPGPPDICGLPETIPAQPTPTSVAIGPDGAYYVGELKGFPAPLGESRVWRIAPNARNAECPVGRSPLCSVVLDGFTSIIDMTFGPDGRLYVAQLDDASWFALGAEGGSVHACTLATGVCEEIVSGIPMLTSITFRGDDLWGVVFALVPGFTDVVPLT
jgi:hypothetical protein